MRGKKILGILLILSPFIIMSGYAITGFMARSIAASLPPSSSGPNTLNSLPTSYIVFNFLSLIFSILGIASILVFIPVGIYMLASSDEKRVAALQQQEKYKNLPVEQVEFIAKWSWGAFFNSLIWSLGNKLYLWSLLSLVPFVSIYAWIKLSYDGRRMAYEEGWNSFAEFKKRQKIMAIIVAVFTALPIILSVIIIPILLATSMSSARLKSAETLRRQQEYRDTYMQNLQNELRPEIKK